MTSAENSTNNSDHYSGLNLGAIQSLAAGTATFDAPVTLRSGKANSNQAQASERSSELSPENSREEQSDSSESLDESISLPPPSEVAMQDYDRLQQNLLILTIVFGAIIFPFVWGFYSLQIALDYILGACGGVVYLRMLGRNVSRIGRQNKNSSASRLAVFAGLMIVALRWDQVEVIPVFLGFLTYKAAIIAFVLWTSVGPQESA